MNLLKTNFSLGFALALSLSMTVGCNRNKAADDLPKFKDVPLNAPSLKNNKVQLDKNARALAAERQANSVAQQMGKPFVPPPTNPAMDVQRSLKTVEEINRMNRLNQQLRQSQPQKR